MARALDMPQDVVDKIVGYSAYSSFPGGIAKTAPEKMEAVGSISAEFRRSVDDMSRQGTNQVVMYSLKPYRPTSNWDHDLSAIIGPGKALNETETLCMGEPQVVHDLYCLALQVSEREDVFLNLQRIAWDGTLALGTENEDLTDNEGPLDLLEILSLATRHLSELHGRNIELCVQAGCEDWNGRSFSPSSSIITWQGDLSGVPRFDLSSIEAEGTYVLDVTDYCQIEPLWMNGELLDMVSDLTRDLQTAKKGSKIFVYLTAHASDRAASARLNGWKEFLERFASGIGGDTGASAEMSSARPVDLRFHVAVQPKGLLQFSIRNSTNRSR